MPERDQYLLYAMHGHMDTYRYFSRCFTDGRSVCQATAEAVYIQMHGELPKWAEIITGWMYLGGNQYLYLKASRNSRVA